MFLIAQIVLSEQITFCVPVHGLSRLGWGQHKMEFKTIKQEYKTEPVETMSFKTEKTMDFKKEIDDDDTFDHGFLPGLATRSF